VRSGSLEVLVRGVDTRIVRRHRVWHRHVPILWVFIVIAVLLVRVHGNTVGLSRRSLVELALHLCGQVRFNVVAGRAGPHRRGGGRAQGARRHRRERIHGCSARGGEERRHQPHHKVRLITCEWVPLGLSALARNGASTTQEFRVHSDSGKGSSPGSESRAKS
jgi:hypothetical protein